MRIIRILALIALCPLVLGACASATKRMDQGMELQMQGRHEAAVHRYVQALEKDPSLIAAREGLQESGALAIEERLADAAQLKARGDLAPAAGQYHAIDTLWATARRVGEKLSLPTDYELQRRAAFDEAIAELAAIGDRAAVNRRWNEGLESYRAARQNFECTRQQRDDLLAAESNILVSWSEEALSLGQLRLAYDLAETVPVLEWSPSEDLDRAEELSALALDAGELELLILPVGSRVRSKELSIKDLALQLDRQLGAGPWRQPPAFVTVSDPVAVRELVRHSGLADQDIKSPALAGLLRLADADFAALVQLVDFSAHDFDVRNSQESARNAENEIVHFQVEKGKRRMTAQLRVVLVDNVGAEIANMLVSGHGDAKFSRGIYAGDPSELRLGSRQLQYFDSLAQDSQAHRARESLMAQLVSQVAQAVYEPVLAQIP